MEIINTYLKPSDTLSLIGLGGWQESLSEEFSQKLIDSSIWRFNQRMYNNNPYKIEEYRDNIFLIRYKHENYWELTLSSAQCTWGICSGYPHILGILSEVCRLQFLDNPELLTTKDYLALVKLRSIAKRLDLNYG